MALATFRDIVIDWADPPKLARFWSQVLGYPPVHEGDEEACLDPGDDPFRLWLVRVPEAKIVKNRVHIDITCGPESASSSSSTWAPRSCTRSAPFPTPPGPSSSTPRGMPERPFMPELN
jgi:hypothetical protein